MYNDLVIITGAWEALMTVVLLEDITKLQDRASLHSVFFDVQTDLNFWRLEKCNGTSR
jgi:hypothetical protein